MTMDNVLVLVRHGESEWNRKNLFTGWRDPDITEKGVAEAHRAGKFLHDKGLKFDIAYTSVLLRANRTLDIILEQVLIWRRSYDIAPPGGESLKDTAARVLPFYKRRIWPDVRGGKNVIVAAHGNSIRALIMYLEELTAKQILEREVATGAPIVYKLTSHGHVQERLDLVNHDA
jgi:2,3-bisphosphoglycerate-dependent phosphoglycerate mutase